MEFTGCEWFLFMELKLKSYSTNRNLGFKMIWRIIIIIAPRNSLAVHGGSTNGAESLRFMVHWIHSVEINQKGMQPSESGT